MPRRSIRKLIAAMPDVRDRTGNPEHPTIAFLCEQWDKLPPVARARLHRRMLARKSELEQLGHKKEKARRRDRERLRLLDDVRLMTDEDLAEALQMRPDRQARAVLEQEYRRRELHVKAWLTRQARESLRQIAANEERLARRAAGAPEESMLDMFRRTAREGDADEC